MLEVRNVSVSYGRHRALEGASLKVAKGEICVILGANGAGKSTLLKVIAGMVRGEPGSAVIMNGKDITTLKAHRIVEEGIALVPEGRGIFGDLTVAENLQLGAFATRARAHEAATLADIYRLFPRLAERKGQVARTMSGGEQQMVAIGRALMSKPDILMLDEPSLGLSPLLSQELFRALAEVAKTGVGILLVEQNARQSLRIAQRGYLIENGQVAGENTAQALMNDPAVVNAYLGGAKTGAAAAPEPQKPRFQLPPVFRLPLTVDAIGRAVSALASRAGRIQWAFIRALRRDAPPPSAFVGRYDPTAIPDPWIEAAAAEPAQPLVSQHGPTVAADARRLGQSASDLALRASERLARHVATTRLSSPRPSAFSSSLLPQIEAEKPVAAEAAAVPVQRAKAEPEPVEPAIPEAPIPEAKGSLIGHNSAGFDVEEEDRQTAAEAQAKAAPVRSQSVSDMAARAAEIQAAHIARNRKTLSPFAPPPQWRPEQPEEPAAVSLPQPAPAETRSTGDSFADLASRAAALHAAHVARIRGKLPRFAVVPQWQPPQPQPIESKPAGTALSTQVEQKLVVEKPASDAIGELVARAASIHAAHVAKNRKGLTAYTIPAQPSLTRAAGHDTKHTEHKEA